MGGMFEGATAFNNDLSGCNESGVIDMGGMFGYATAFTNDLSG